MAKVPSHLISVLFAHLLLLPVWVLSQREVSRHRHQHGATGQDLLPERETFDRLSEEVSLSDEQDDGENHRPLTDSYDRNVGRCEQCELRAEQKEMRVEFAKYQILKKLGMERPPNVTGQIPPIPILTRTMDQVEMQRDGPYLSQYYDDRYDRNDEDFVENMKLITTSPFPSHVYSDPGTDVYFRLPRHTDPSHLLSAKLHVYVRGSRSGRDTSAILLIQVINPVERTANIIRKKKLPVGSYRHGEWLQFSVLELVRHWADQPLSNNGLRIEAYDEVTGENLALVQGRTQGEAAYRPVLEIKDKPPSRHRRDSDSVMVCRENSTETSCCRFPLEVNFEKFGWDWVIAPRSYTANYCSGKCGFVFKTMHRATHVIQQSSNKIDGAGPCCSPKKLAPLRLIYFDENHNIIWGKLAAMIVKECGCA